MTMRQYLQPAGDPSFEPTVKGLAMVSIPRQAELTLRITMSVEDWLQFRQQLIGSYPSNDVGGLIDEVADRIDDPIAIGLSEGFGG